MELRQYQKEISNKAAIFLKENGIVYLSMQTRTGKTITAFNIINLNGYKKVLFVTKKKAIQSILSDFKAFKCNFGIDVINYESVEKMPLIYDVAVCDESHSLGTYPKPSKRYKDLKKIVYNIPVILMSATPSPESYSQLFHQFTINKFHSWNKAKNFYHWAKYYVIPAKKFVYGNEINDYSNANQEAIEKATGDYFFSISQNDAGIENTIKEHLLYCELRPETYEKIKHLQKYKVLRLDNNEVVLADTAVKEMQKCHQIFSGTVKTESGAMLIIDSSKAAFIKDYFAGKRIVVFYKFIAELNLLKMFFPDYTDNQVLFQKGLSNIFLGQFQSAREGIRLDSADAIIFYNIDFSFLSYEQAKNRIVSKERNKQANLYFIFSKNGIEERIYNVVKNKQDYTLNYYKKDYERTTNSGENNKKNGGGRLVRGKGHSNKQERIPGLDLFSQRRDNLH